MRRSIAFIGLLAVLLCLWTISAHAITLKVTDDTYTQQDKQTLASGVATSLSVDSSAANQEHITYVVFDPQPLPQNLTTNDHVVLRFFVNKVTKAGI